MQTQTQVKLTKDNAKAGLRVVRIPKPLQSVTSDRVGTLQPIPPNCVAVFPSQSELVTYRLPAAVAHHVSILWDGWANPEDVYLQYLAIVPQEEANA